MGNINDNSSLRAEIDKAEKRLNSLRRRLTDREADQEETRKAQQATFVALFDSSTGTRVSGWYQFAIGKIPVPDSYYLPSRYPETVHPDVATLQLRNREGSSLSGVETHVQEHTVTSYSVTWRTMW